MQTYNDMLNILANYMSILLFGLNLKNNFLFLYAYKSEADEYICGWNVIAQILSVYEWCWFPSLAGWRQVKIVETCMTWSVFKIERQLFGCFQP